ncbi:hypothetical protein D3C83_330660 [compost metagenome]
MISRITMEDVVAGRLESIALKTMWLVIAIGRSASPANGAKSVAASSARSASTIGRV